jgi:hypothetical protein
VVSLRERGFLLVADGDRLHVSPGSRLTATDCAALQALKHDVLGCLPQNVTNAQNVITSHPAAPGHGGESPPVDGSALAADRAAFADAERELDAKAAARAAPRTCYCCKGDKFWRATRWPDLVRCLTCHPPAPGAGFEVLRPACPVGNPEGAAVAAGDVDLFPDLTVAPEAQARSSERNLT